jgi:hypothetical protein
MKVTRGRLAALNTHGRVRRGALVCVLSTVAVAIGLIAAPAASAWGGGGCPSGAAAIHPVGPTPYTVNTMPQPRLRGHVGNGVVVTATFTVDARCAQGVEVNLPSYTAPRPTFNANDQQTVSDFGDGSVVSGPYFPDGMQHTITTHVQQPCYFQVDFVRGPVIQVGPTSHYGINLVDADNGGTLAC